MAAIAFPPRKCLTCVTNNNECDGEFPVCSSCQQNKQPCLKPQIEIDVPWERLPSPYPAQGVITESQATFTSDMLFKDEFIHSNQIALIKGITEIYKTLLKMQYIEVSELKLPPHLNFPSEMLAQIGLEPEAIALLRQLPYLDIEGEISAYTNSYNYLYNVEGARQVLWESGNDLAPWVIRLSDCKPYPSWHGRTIIYDIRIGSIIQWYNNEPAYTNTYLDLPNIPTEEFFAQWLSFLIDLKEIPWRQGYNGGVLFEPPAPPFGYIDLLANGYSNDLDEVASDGNKPSLDGYNLKQAQKSMYLNHGWPDSFHGEEFRASRKMWQLEHDRLDKARSVAMRMSCSKEKKKAFQDYSEFLEYSTRIEKS